VNSKASLELGARRFRRRDEHPPLVAMLKRLNHQGWTRTPPNPMGPSSERSEANVALLVTQGAGKSLTTGRDGHPPCQRIGVELFESGALFRPGSVRTRTDYRWRRRRAATGQHGKRHGAERGARACA
jgi:hypothetical protein